MDSSRPRNADRPYRAPSGDAATTGWKIVRQLCGWGLLALGVAGLLLPILPGWCFIVWGVVILTPDVPFLGRLLDRLAQRVPALRSTVERMRGK